MDPSSQNEQPMGNIIVPGGAQRAKSHAVSRRGADLIRSRTNVPDRIGREDNKTEGRKMEVSQGDGTSRIRGKRGKEDFTTGMMDTAS